MSSPTRTALPLGGLRLAVLLLAALLLGPLAPAGPAAAQQTLRVIDTAPNDVLNIREYPSAEARIVGVIPPDGRGIVPTGEANGNWIFVRYRNVEGWVWRRFVAPDAPPVRRGRSLEGAGSKN